MYLRNRDCKTALLVDGAIKGGSFKRLESFEISGGDEIEEVELVGEEVPDLDRKKGVYSLTLKYKVVDASHHDLNEAIDQRDAAGMLPSKYALMVIIPFRSPSEPARTMVLKALMLKLDNLGGGGSDLAMVSYSGKARFMEWR
jgi:hypothetical protein